MSSSWRAKSAVIFFTVLIDLIGFGIVLPILPYYAQRFGAHGLGYGALVMIFSAMQFVATTILGRLSDRIGRRPIILATTLINAAGYVLFAFAGSFEILFVARLISGFAGGNISAAQAYMADVTSPAERSRGMGMLGAAFGLGFSFGPLVGGLAQHFGGPLAPGLLAAVLSLANFVSAYFILPESLSVEHRTRRPLFDFAHIGEVFSRPRLRPLLIVWIVAPFAFAGYTVILPFQAQAAFGWNETHLMIFFVEVGLTAALVQGIVFGKLARRWGEGQLLVAGLIGMTLGIGLVPLMPSGLTLYLWTLVLAASNSLFAPAATGLVSIYASPAEQGAVLGAAQAMAALGRMAGPLALGLAYDRVGGPATLVAAGVFMLVGALVAMQLEPLSPGLTTSVAGSSGSPPVGDTGHSGTA
jgi:MFS transporter, DHA1 family, tetracycline resistance protein